MHDFTFTTEKGDEVRLSERKRYLGLFGEKITLEINGQHVHFLGIGTDKDHIHHHHLPRLFHGNHWKNKKIFFSTQRMPDKGKEIKMFSRRIMKFQPEH